MKSSNCLTRCLWHWDPQYDKRDKHDILRSLIISGALIAAQIDLLQSGDGV